MKRSLLFTVAFGLAALLGTTSCTSNNATQAEVKTQQEIKLGGSSSTHTAIKLLGEAYAIQNQNVKFTFLPKGQSGSGIAGVKQGLRDVAGVSRKLKLDEDDGSINYKQLATDGLVVATHPSVKGISNLTTQQLKAIYSGAVTNWQELGGPNEEIIVLDRPEDESAKRLLRKHYLGKELKNAPKAAIMRYEPELINALQNTPYSIGTFSLAYTISNKLPVNRLSLNNIEPTQANIKSGKYSMVRSIGVVWNKKPSEITQKYLDFAFSKKGAEILNNSGFVPSTDK
ncbi:phosphate ABC transporter periplasmic phosphate-binding protein [Calothrix parasitica NIES-267]|uniref:Phosphate ABC transporter periplasmic phosphate-binding protein n=1 Tax=Calothrix parasitica NIES-267 TaxID=1973488 RepID=A0A1Z4LYS4_9CYAN|nr:phosphate ABC transporter periplasmic phosphate-binding protein [Calothrix parasitica NIES-267]